MSNLIKLRKKLEDKFHENFELDIAASSTAILLVIDNSFDKKDREARLKMVEPLFSDAGVDIGIADLYTESEAAEMGISIGPIEDNYSPATWDDAVNMASSGLTARNSNNFGKKPRRIVFYSYKGGVGRTTALVHTAFHLARSGLRGRGVDVP